MKVSNEVYEKLNGLYKRMGRHRYFSTGTLAKQIPETEGEPILEVWFGQSNGDSILILLGMTYHKGGKACSYRREVTVDNPYGTAHSICEAKTTILGDFGSTFVQKKVEEGIMKHKWPVAELLGGKPLSRVGSIIEWLRKL